MDIAELQDLVIDDRERGLFRVNRRVFTDPEILERERREVFDRSWLYAGHESEIANPGDFVARRVGGRPLILVSTTPAHRTRSSTPARIAVTPSVASAPARPGYSAASITPGPSISAGGWSASPATMPTRRLSTVTRSASSRCRASKAIAG
jgi:hypothetical protein